MTETCLSETWIRRRVGTIFVPKSIQLRKLATQHVKDLGCFLYKRRFVTMTHMRLRSDFIMTQIVFRSIRNRYTDWHFTILTDPHFCGQKIQCPLQLSNICNCRHRRVSQIHWCCLDVSFWWFFATMFVLFCHSDSLLLFNRLMLLLSL